MTPFFCALAELEAIGLSAVQQVELDCVQQLARGNHDEQRQSIKQLAQLPACDATQQAVAACLKDDELTVRVFLCWFYRCPCNKICTGMPEYRRANSDTLEEVEDGVLRRPLTRQRSCHMSHESCQSAHREHTHIIGPPGC